METHTKVLYFSCTHSSTCNDEDVQFLVCISQPLSHCGVILQGEMEQQVIWSPACSRHLTDLHFGQ